MPRTNLTEARVRALNPSKTVRDIHYATTEMPNLADRLSQEPVGYSRGADFAIAGLN